MTTAAEWFEQGQALAAKGAWDEAFALWQKSIAADTDFIDAYLHMGVHFSKRHDWAQARQMYEKARALDARRLETYLGLSFVGLHSGDAEAGLSASREALRLAPDHPEVQFQHALALERNLHLQEALQFYRMALEGSPQDWRAQLGMGFLALLTRHYPLGWELQEARLENADLYPQGVFWRRDLPENLEGQSIYIVDEQGFGDTLQAARFFSLLKDKGASVNLISNPSLLSFLARAEGVDRCLEDLEVAPGSIVLPIMSLPLRLKIFEESQFLAGKKFVAPQVEAAEAWKLRLASLSKTPTASLRVGIAYRGNPDHPWDAVRSFSIDWFLPLAQQHPDLEFYSLQYGESAEEQAKGGGAGIRHQTLERGLTASASKAEQIENLAAFISNLDLVITCDSFVAHLAGTLQVPTWVLIPPVPDWRWQLEREDSPWYPTMKLFRAQRAKDWTESFARISSSLRTLKNSAMARR